MRNADRSLEITALGLGQAGGRIAAEFQRRGYRALAFNNAKADLASLTSGRIALPEAQCIHIALDGGDGAGVNPGVPAVERPGPAGLQDNARGHGSRRFRITGPERRRLGRRIGQRDSRSRNSM